MGPKEIDRFCELNETSLILLKTAMEKLNLSARAYDRILKVARTIADLENSPYLSSAHISEAIQYRSLDREFGTSDEAYPLTPVPNGFINFLPSGLSSACKPRL